MDTPFPNDTPSDEFEPRPYKAGIVADLIELDRDIMKLLVRRAKLVGKLRGGKGHAASPAAARAEKEVRSAWEKNAAAFSRDDKFARQLFSLLQEVRVEGRHEAESRGGFNLAPANKPVSVAIPGPRSCIATRMAAVFAAWFASDLALPAVVLNDPLMDCVKALNSAGAKFSWTAGERSGEGSLSHAGAAASVSLTTDRALYIGEDSLTMYLMAFLAAEKVGKARFTGGSGLKMADLSPLRRFLPELGARMAHSVPKSNGLPANVESSGMLPDRVTVPADLPKEGMIALLTAAAAWKKRTTLDCGAVPEALFAEALAECLPMLRSCGVDVSPQGISLVIDAASAALPRDAAEILPLDTVCSAYLLALPAFAGGRVALAGRWDASLPLAESVFDLLERAGLAANGDNEGARSERAQDSPDRPVRLRDFSGLGRSLLPLAMALAVREVRRTKGEVALSLPECADAGVVDSFCSHLGVVFRDGSYLSPGRPVPKDEAMPWTSPSPEWAMAFALCSYDCPNVRLTNPAAVGALMPSFWALFNALPDPSLVKKVPEAPQITRRRIIPS